MAFWSASLVGCSGAAVERGPSSLAIEPFPRDVETTRLHVTQEALDAVAAFSDSAAVLDRMRQEISPEIVWVPTLPALLRYRQRDLATVQEMIARIKTASRRYFDAEAYRNAVEGLPEESFEVVRQRKESSFTRRGRRTLRRLPYVDSLSTRRARLLDITTPEVQDFLYRLGTAKLNVRIDSGLVVVGDSVLGRLEEVERIWSIGEPLTVYVTGSGGRNANPLLTRFSVPIYREGRVYNIITFNAYAGSAMSWPVLSGDGLDASRFPVMTLAKAQVLVNEQTGEQPVRAVHIDPAASGLVTFPAVITDEGSVYIVDPILETVW